VAARWIASRDPIEWPTRIAGIRDLECVEAAQDGVGVLVGSVVAVWFRGIAQQVGGHEAMTVGERVEGRSPKPA
jgi:hypothetical protein